MPGETWSAQVPRILSALASINGRQAIDVVERKFPRVGPAERGTGYQERIHRCNPDALPAELPISHDTEEIVITLRGAAKTDPDRIRRDLAGVPERIGFGPDWDLRWKVAEVAEQQHFELTVFTSFAGRGYEPELPA